MIQPRAPLPPRARTPSGHDVPIPEAVFLALHNLQGSVEDLGRETRAGFAAQAVVNADLKVAVETAGARSVERWTNLAKALVPAVIAIVGGTVGAQRLMAPEPQKQTVVSESALSSELDACMTLPESNQRLCMDQAYERDRMRKLSRQRP